MQQIGFYGQTKCPILEQHDVMREWLFTHWPFSGTFRFAPQLKWLIQICMDQHATHSVCSEASSDEDITHNLQ